MQKKTSKDNKKGTFLVNVCYCENATWQGHVVWAEQNKKEYFRSALELIRIMEDALEQSAADSESSVELIRENKAVND